MSQTPSKPTLLLQTIGTRRIIRRDKKAATKTKPHKQK